MVAGDVAASWFVDVEKHIVRRADYKGTRQKHRICLAFDGLTLPGVLFIAICQHLDTTEESSTWMFVLLSVS